MKRNLHLLITVAMLLCFPKASFGQAPDLGRASGFTIFTSGGAISNIGASIVTGDVGNFTGADNFNGATINGTHFLTGSPETADAKTDLALAYLDISNRPSTALGVTIVDTTLTPGTYATGALATLNGTVTLDGQGDPNALFIIKVGGAFSTGTNATVKLINGASMSNVFWQVDGAFALGDSSKFIGNILANGAISLLEGSSLQGRALSTPAGAISLHNNNVSNAEPCVPVTISTQPSDLTLCTGTGTPSFTLVAAGDGPFTYQWQYLDAGVWNNVVDGTPTNALYATANTETLGISGITAPGTYSYKNILTNCTGANTVTSNTVTLTINPNTGTPVIAGNTVLCQDSPDETYLATATNSTLIVYSVTPVAAGIIDASTGVMDWDAAFSGPATVTATATGLCGTTSTDLVVTINPNTGTPVIAGNTVLCQDSPDETYLATATNSTSIVYSVTPVAAGIIDASTGVMDWDAAFSGPATVTATATGLCGTTSTDLVVTINPGTGTPVIAGNTVLCQDSPDETYLATATNSTLIIYSVTPASAGIIDASTGVMDWDAAFSGLATIRATATGLCTSPFIDLVVTINPNTGNPIFTGSTTLCQDSPNETYLATATNSTLIVYSVTPVAAGIIDASTGVMDWDAAFSGPATIRATATGSCTTTFTDLVVNINPNTSTPVIAGNTVLCQDSPDETYLATAANSTSIAYSVTPASAGIIDASTGVMNWDAAFSGLATIRATAIGLCTSPFIDLLVTVNPLPLAAGIISGAIKACQTETGVPFSVASILHATGYIWTLPAGATIASGDNTNSITVDFGANAVSGNIFVQGSNSCGVGALSSAFAIPVRITLVALASSNSPVCEGSSINLTAQTEPGGVYIWTGPNGFASNVQNPVIPNATAAQAGVYTLVVATPCYCCFSAPSTVTIVVNNCDSADLSITMTVDNIHPFMGRNVEFAVTATNLGPDKATEVIVTNILPDGYTYVSSTVSVSSYDSNTGLWDIGTLNQGESELMTIIATVNTTGNYTNKATVTGIEADEDPTNNEASVTTIPTDFFIPEGFSPNGDGINDLFFIRGLQNYPANKIVIYNRWGNKVYEASPYLNNWDGQATIGLRVNGSDLPTGTYFYLLDLGDGTDMIKGTIYLNQ